MRFTDLQQMNDPIVRWIKRAKLAKKELDNMLDDNDMMDFEDHCSDNHIDYARIDFSRNKHGAKFNITVCREIIHSNGLDSWPIIEEYDYRYELDIAEDPDKGLVTDRTFYFVAGYSAVINYKYERFELEMNAIKKLIDEEIEQKFVRNGYFTLEKI